MEAARNCLQQADLAADQLDFILVATMTPDHLTPSTACVVQQGLGAHCPAMDVNAACAGFMYGLITGMHYNPVSRKYRLGPGVDINYIVHYSKPLAS
jgi:3-oxoacyl-[acyl-carrier-protein] synthase-3